MEGENENAVIESLKENVASLTSDLVDAREEIAKSDAIYRSKMDEHEDLIRGLESDLVDARDEIERLTHQLVAANGNYNAASRDRDERLAELRAIASYVDAGHSVESVKGAIDVLRAELARLKAGAEPAGERVDVERRRLPNAVKQTTPSNCFAGCVASLLNVPIDEIPGVDGKAWDWSAFEDWLATKGLQAVEMTFGNGGTLYPVRVPVPCILSGKSPHGDRPHAVCAEFIGLDGFNLTHDPHESGKMIDGDPVHATFFVPLDLALLADRPEQQARLKELSTQPQTQTKGN